MNQSAVTRAQGTPTLTAYKLDQPEYLTNNWKLLQANCEYYGSTCHRYAKVKDGIVSVTNSRVVIRCPAALQDGFYLISEENEFIGGDPTQNRPWYNFPDYDAVMPNFKVLDYTPPVPRDLVSTIVEYCNFVRKNSTSHRDRIAVEGSTLIAVDLQDSWLTLPYPIPVNTGSLVFEAYDLKLAFTEMLRYDSIHIGFDNILPDNSTLVIGRDWGHCALLIGK